MSTNDIKVFISYDDFIEIHPEYIAPKEKIKRVHTVVSDKTIIRYVNKYFEISINDEKLKSVSDRIIQVKDSVGKTGWLPLKYVLQKILILEGINDFTMCFRILASREKLQKYDILWEAICNDLNWQFQPTQ